MRDSAIYSASAELNATAGCSFEPNAIRQLPRKMRYPVRERREAFQEAQSESTWPDRSHGSCSPLYVCAGVEQAMVHCAFHITHDISEGSVVLRAVTAEF